MDPVACLIRLLEAVAEDDLTEAGNAADDLQAWTTKRGYTPINLVGTAVQNQVTQDNFNRAILNIAKRFAE